MFELALVGCPSSGKSTFFKAATLKDAKIAPYPFTTTDPDQASAFVTTKCPCADLLVEPNVAVKRRAEGTSMHSRRSYASACGNCIDNVRFVPIKLWDIAGLVPDAHRGKGRGIGFLDDIRQAQCLLQIIDASGRTDLEGNPTKDFDPYLAIMMLEKEFNYWMVGIFKKMHAHRHAKEPFSIAIEKQFSGLSINAGQANKAAELSDLDIEDYISWTDDKIFLFVDNLRKISKPSLIIANKADIPEAEYNIKKMKELSEKNVIAASADYELALREAAKENLIKYIPGSSSFEVRDENKLSPAQKSALKKIADFLEKQGSTGVQPTINTAAFDLLDLIVVYPVADSHKLSDSKGRILPDAFLLKKGSTAKDLAFAVHEDIGKKFISATDAKTQRGVSSEEPLKNGAVISIKAGR